MQNQNTQIFLSDKQAAQRYGVNRTTIWRWVKIAGFPTPFMLSRGCTRWALQDIQRWEETGAAKNAQN